MTRLATILLLAATINAQFAGDAAAGGTATKPKLPKQTNWMGHGLTRGGVQAATDGRFACDGGSPRGA